MTTDFLREFANHKLFGGGDLVVKCYEKELAESLREQDPKSTEFTKQFKEAEEHNKNLANEVKFPDYKKKMHTGAVYHSQLLPTKEITRILQELSGSSTISMSGLLDSFPNTSSEESQQSQQQAQILQPTYGTPSSSK
ncbi:12920_t:CDS:2 [Entrophospora sp. SA101]|nr:15415_t:CDS:2 [Entrophospora sp. SA101]CAJ0747016.1 12920_t:CDS:2 [Entrophospora sp. SA101]CAJ0844828.1 3797_t:CDS:2 [Entrophospora sp. SA101]